jgi:hypothetical protein
MMANRKGVWLFTRGSESIRLVREEDSDGCRLFIYGPRTEVATYDFADVAQCMKQQAAIEMDMLAAGYQVAGPPSERRADDGLWHGLDHRRAAG